MELQLQSVGHVSKHTEGLRPPNHAAIKLSAVLLEKLRKLPFVTVVNTVDVKGQAVGCTSENGKLKAAAVSLPTYLDWDAPINAAEAANMLRKPSRYRAVEQHVALIEALLGHGVELTMILPGQDRLEGVYARDIGMVIGDKCIHANFVASPRIPEEKEIAGGIKPPPGVKLEGGNVMVDGNLVFLGVGDRTNLAAVTWLQGILGTAFEVKPILLAPGVLHLDCAFSPIAKPNGTGGGALVYTPAFLDTSDLELFAKIYGRTFSVGTDEYLRLGLNTFALDPETRIVTPGAPAVIDILTRELHQRVVPIALDQIVKGEGYARCSVMPLLRA